MSNNSWKQYGGLSKVDSLNTITVGTIVADQFISRSSNPVYQLFNGTFEVTVNLIADNDLLIGNSSFVKRDLFVTGNTYANNKIFFGGNQHLLNDLSYVAFTVLPSDSSYSFIFGNSSNIGINTIAPNSTFNITGYVEDIMTVETSFNSIRNILAQNKNKHGIVASSNNIISTLAFFNDSSTNTVNEPDAKIQYNLGGILNLSTSKGIESRSQYSLITTSGGIFLLNKQNSLLQSSGNIIFDTSAGYLLTASGGKMFLNPSLGRIQMDASGDFLLNISGGIFYLNQNTATLSSAGSVILNSSGGFIHLNSNKGTGNLLVDSANTFLNSNNTILSTFLNITTPKYIGRDVSGKMYNETVTIYDNSNSIFMPNIYDKKSVKTGNAISIVAVDPCSNTFLRIVSATNKQGAAFAGGVFPNNSNRSMALIGLNDKSGNYVPSQTIVTGIDPIKYYSTIGINTFSPKTDNYVLDINGPTHIGNGELQTFLNANFQIYTMSFSKSNPKSGIITGTSVSITSPYLQYIYYTNDGGITWIQSQLDPQNLYRLSSFNLSFYTSSMYDSNYGIIGASQNFLFYTNDGGISWYQMQNFLYNTNYTDNVYRNTSSICITNNGNSIRIFNAYKYNNSYTNQIDSYTKQIRFFDIQKSNLLNSFNGTTYAIRIFNEVTSSIDIKTSDSSGNYIYFAGTGISKYTIASPESNSLYTNERNDVTYNDIYVFDDNTVIAVGNNIISYTDDGTNWTDIFTNLNNFANINSSSGNINLKGVFIYDLLTAVIVGDNGLFIYTNSGFQASSWKTISSEIMNTNGIGNQILNSNNYLAQINMQDINSFVIANNTSLYNSTNYGISTSYGKSKIIYGFLPNLFNRVNNRVLDVSGNMFLSGDVNVNDGGKIMSNNKDFYILNETVKNIYFGQEMQTMNIGNYDASTNLYGFLYLSRSAHIQGDVSINSRLMVQGDVSLNSRLFVNSDVSFNKRLCVGGDVSLSLRLFVGGDVSLNQRLYASGDVSFNSRLSVTSDVSFNRNINIQGKSILNDDVSMNQRLFVGGDTSLNIRLFVGGDVSLNQRLYTSGDVSFNSRLSVTSDVSFNRNINIQGKSILNDDVSMNQRLFVGGDTSLNIRLFVGGDVSLNQRLYASGDVSFNSRLSVTSDVSFNRNINIQGKSILHDDVSMNQRLFVGGDTSLNIRLFVGGDVSLNQRLYVSGDASFNSNFQVFNQSILNGDVSINNRLFVYNDVSMNNRLFVASDVSFNRNFQVFNETVLNGDVSMNNRLYVQNDVSFGGNFYLPGSVLQTISILGNSWATNYGNNFPIFTNNVYSITSSTDLKYILFCTGNTPTPFIETNNVYFSTNYGYNWKQINCRNIRVVSISSYGQYILLSGYKTQLLFSNDFGVTFNSFNPLQNNTPNNSSLGYYGGPQSISSSGQYIIISSCIGSNNYISTDFGNTWTDFAGSYNNTIITDSSSYVTCAVSGNGQYMLLAGGYLSSNYGNWWSQPIYTNTNTNINYSISYDGKYMIIDGYYSTNYGNYWITSPTYGPTSISSNGQLMMIGNYLSSNYGKSFQKQNILPTNYGASFISSDNKYSLYINTSRLYLLTNNITNVTAFMGIGIMQPKVQLDINGDFQVSNRVFIVNDVSMNNHLYVGGDVSFNSNLDISGTVILHNDVSMNQRLFIGNDVSLNQRLFVGSDVSFNNNFQVYGKSIFNSDVSLNSRLFIGGDLSINNRVYVGGDITIYGRLNVENYTNNNIINTTTNNYSLIISEDLSLNGRLFVLNDTSLNGDVFINGDVSMNNRLIIGGDVSLNNRLYVSGDVSFNKNLQVNGISNLSRLIVKNDVSFNNNFTVTNLSYFIGNVNLSSQLLVGGNSTFSGDVTFNGGKMNINSEIKLNTISTQNDADFGTRIYVGDDADISGRLYVANDASFNRNLIVSGTSILNNDVSMNNRLFVQNDVSFNNRLFVASDVSFNKNFQVFGKTIHIDDVSMNKSLFVQNDVSFNNRLFVASDVSFNKNFQVTGKTILNDNVILNNRLYVNNDSSFNNNVQINNQLNVLGDLSLNSKLTVGNGDTNFYGNVSFHGKNVNINSQFELNTINALYDSNFAQRIFVLGDVSINNRLYVKNDTSLNGILHVLSNTILNGDVSMNQDLIIGGDLSLNQRLYITGDSTFNGRLSINNDVSFNNKFQVSGISVFQKDVSINTRLFTSNINIPYNSSSLSTLNIGNWNNSSVLNLTFNATNSGNTFNYYIDNFRQNLLFGQNSGSQSAKWNNDNSNISRNLAISYNSLSSLLSTKFGVNYILNSDNIAIGHYSSAYLQYGHHNTTIGSYSMTNLGLTQSDGTSAPYGDENSINPIIVPTNTGSTYDNIYLLNTNKTSSYNTIIGYNTMNSPYIFNQSSSNTVIGANAFSNFSTAYGSLTNPSNFIWKQNTFIGFNAQPTYGVTSNQIVLGTSTETTYIPGMFNVTYDASFGSRLSVLFDVSLNKRLFVGGDVSFNTRLTVGGDVSFNQAFQVIGKSIFIDDVSMNQRLFIYNDVSFNNRLFVGSDVSFNRNFQIFGQSVLNGDVFMNSRLGLNNDATFNSRFFILGDVSFNNRLYVASDVSFNRNFQIFGQTINMNDVSMNTRLFIGGDVSMNGRLSILNDVSFNQRFYVGSTSIFNGDSTINSRAFILGDASLNKNLFIAGDSSFNSRLSILSDVSFNRNFQVLGTSILNGDVSMNNRLFVGNDLTIYGRLNVNNYTNNNVINTTTTNYSLVIAEDLSVNNRLFVGQDVSFAMRLSVAGDISANQRLFVNGDSIINSRLFVASDVSFNRVFQVIGQSVLNGDVSMNSRVFINGDVSMNSRLFVTSDISMGNRLFINADVSMNNRLYVASDVSFNRNFQVFGQTINMNDVSVNSRLFVGGDVSFNQKFYVGLNSIFIGDVSINSRLFILGDVSFNNRLFIGSDVSFNRNFQVAGQSMFLNDISLSGRLFTNNIYTPYNSTLYGSTLQISNSNNTSSLSLTFFGTDTGNTFNYYIDNLRQNLIFGETAGYTIINGSSLNSNLTTTGADLLTTRNLAISNGALSSLISTTNPGGTLYRLVTSDNTAIGYNSAKNLDYGHHNTAIGSYSMSNIGLLATGGITSTGLLNILPINSGTIYDNVNNGQNISSSYNTVVGFNTMNGQYIQSKSYNNTVIGANAFSNFTTPDSGYHIFSQNTFIGFNAQPVTGLYNNQIVLGTISETTYIPGMLNVTFDASFGSRLSVLNDVSFNKRMFVGGDASFNTRLTVGGDVSFNRNFIVFGQSVFNSDISMNSRAFINSDVFMNSRLFIASDVSMYSRVFIQNDVSLNNRLYVASDVSFNRNFQILGQSILNSDVLMNSRLFINGDVSMNSRLFLNSDASFNNRLFVGQDVSFNNRLFVGSDVSFGRNFQITGVTIHNSDTIINNRLFVVNDTSFGMRLLVGSDVSLNQRLFTAGDVSFNSRFSVLSDVSFNRNFQVFGTSILNGDVSMNSRVFIGQDLTVYGRLNVNNYTNNNIINTTTTNYTLIIAEDLSLNNRLFVGQDVSFAMRLSVAGDISANQRLFVTGDSVINNRLFVGQDVSFNKNFQVIGQSVLNGDVSMNSRVFINGDVSLNQRLFVLSDVSLNQRLFVLCDVSMNGRISVLNDASFNQRLFVGSNAVFNRDISVYNRLFSTSINTTTTNKISINALVGSQNFSNNQGFLGSNGSQNINVPNYNLYFSTNNISTASSANNFDQFIDNPRNNFFMGQYLTNSQLYLLYSGSFGTNDPNYNSPYFINNLGLSSNALGNIGTSIGNAYYSSDNVAIGYNSIGYLNDGHSNTAIGSNSMANIGLYSSSGYGSANINALIKTIPTYITDTITSNFNTSIGFYSMSSANIYNTSNKNTVIGSLAFSDSNYSITKGIYTQNTFIGYNAQPISNVFSNQIVLGTSTETTYIPGAFQVITDASINGRLCINSDLSLNGRFFFNSTAIPNNSIPYLAIANLATSVNALVTSGIAQISSSNSSASVTALTLTLDGQFNFATNWLQVSNTAYTWYDNAMSMTGQYQTAVEYPGWIWNSNDFGVTWSKSLIYNGTTYATTNSLIFNWSSVAISYSGQYQIASFIQDPIQPFSMIYMSTNYGNHWNISFPNSAYSNSDINALAISSTGQYQYASLYNNFFISSTTYGSNWSAPTLSNNLASGNWQAISTSSNGQYVCFAGNNTFIYTSANYGATIQAAGNIAASWISISMSYSGQYIIAAPGGYSSSLSLPKNSASNATPKPGYLYFSSNFGSSFYAITAAPNTVWTSAKISGNGQYIIALSQDGATQGAPSWAWYSYNYGFTWFKNSNLFRYWLGSAISSTGEYVTIVSKNNNIYTSQTGYRNQNISNLLTVNNANITGNLIVTGISAPIQLIDGSVLSTGALSLDYANNFGSFWTNQQLAISTNSGSYFNNISMSLTGQIQTSVSNNYIFTSNNYGINWQTNYGSTAYSFSNVSISASGQYQYVCGNPGFVYSSSNYGINWATCYSTSSNWVSISSSYSGQYVIFGGITTYLYLSSNYGTNFYTVGSIDITNSSQKAWQSVNISSSGQYIYVLASNDTIYYSNNFGISWSISIINSTVTNGAKFWQFLSCSANGQFVYAAAGNNNASINTVATIVNDTIYVSTNFGYSFIQSSAPQTIWQSISASASGQYILACSQSNTITPASTANNGYIYTSVNYGQTWVQQSTSYSALFNGCYVSSDAQFLATCSNIGIGVSTTPFAFFAVKNNLTVGSQITLYGGNGLVNAASFNATSDYRVKTNITEIDYSFAMDHLRKIKPVNFEYIDKSINSKNNLGFIAQDIENVIEYAVSKGKNFIPNIYESITIKDNIVQLKNKFTTDISLCDYPIKLKFNDISGNEYYNTIDSIIDSKTILMKNIFDVSSNQLFLYGQEVDDFLSINKDSIFTITTRAVQYLDNKLQDAVKTINEQNVIIKSLKNDILDLKLKMEIFLHRFDI